VDFVEGSSDGLELSLKLYHAGELQLRYPQLMAEAPRHRIHFRAEFFNAFNNVNYNYDGYGLDTNFDSPNFGRITNADTARQIQFGLKYGF
jgi:hypothetical protein